MLCIRIHIRSGGRQLSGLMATSSACGGGHEDCQTSRPEAPLPSGPYALNKCSSPLPLMKPHGPTDGDLHARIDEAMHAALTGQTEGMSRVLNCTGRHSC